MGISLSDLPPEYRKQATDKLLREEKKSGRTVAVRKVGGGQNKLHAQKVVGCLNDGTQHTFDSVREHDRYRQLALLERAGAIQNLRVQVKYPLLPKQTRADGKAERGVSYIADFVYEKDGETIVEDSKGYRNPGAATYATFVLKRKLMLYIHGITVREV